MTPKTCPKSMPVPQCGIAIGSFDLFPSHVAWAILALGKVGMLVEVRHVAGNEFRIVAHAPHSCPGGEKVKP